MHRTSSIRVAALHIGVVSALVIGYCTPGWASHVGEDLTTDQQVVSSTDTLLRTLQQWEMTPAAQRSQRTAQLAQMAAQRRARLLTLLQRNPTVAASRFIPAAVRARLPAEAQAYVEREVRASGSVVARIGDDFARGVSKKEFLLHLNDNAAQQLTLHLANALDAERDMLGFVGRKVGLTAMQLDGNLVITDRRAVLVAADGTGSTPTTVGTTPIVKGDKKTLSILLSFNDSALTCTADDVQNRLFGSTGATVNTNFRNSSRNLVSFSGRAIGPFTINYSQSGACDYNGWANAAETAARAAGVDPSQYAHVNYVTPRNSNCGWSGLAYMPGRQSWVASCTSTGVYSHELGHNVSLHHAGSPTAEYGDGSDPMGGAKPVLFNGANRVMAGWMAPGTVVDITASGSFPLDALSLPAATSPQVMRIYKADTKEWYHVSLRQAQDLDAGLSTTYVDAVSITKASGTLPAKTILMAALKVGGSWSDAANGITITHQALAGSTSTVGVTMAGAVCTRATPGITVSPASQSGAPGASRSFSVAVKNNDSAACGSSSIGLAQALPAGFTGDVPAAIAVSPGSTGSSTWTVTPAATVAAGSYGLDITASAGGSASTAHGSYSVVGDTTPPSVAITYPTDGSTIGGSRATLSATASDADSGVARVEFYFDGKLLATDSSAPYTATLQLRKLAKGVPHLIRVRAVDGVGNAAESVSTVTIK